MTSDTTEKGLELLIVRAMTGRTELLSPPHQATDTAVPVAGGTGWLLGDTRHVAADTAYQNAQKNSDKQNARIEHDKALNRVMIAVLKDDTELYKKFSDDEDFRRWLTDAIFDLTYEGPLSSGAEEGRPNR